MLKIIEAVERKEVHETITIPSMMCLAQKTFPAKAHKSAVQKYAGTASRSLLIII